MPRREDANKAAREKAAREWRMHPRSEVHVDVAATSGSGKSGKDIEIHAQADFVTINTHGDARLDREMLIELQKRHGIDSSGGVVAARTLAVIDEMATVRHEPWLTRKVIGPVPGWGVAAGGVGLLTLLGLALRR